MADFLLYDPTTNEIRGHVTVSHEQLAYNTEGGRLVALELDGDFRSVSMGETGIVQSFNMDSVRKPLLAKIDADALALIADPFEAIHAAQAAEARGEVALTPYLDALQAATGKTRKMVVDEVLAAAAAAEARKISINAKRQAAKAAIAGQSTIPGMYTASLVDWNS